jgi:hypothetical protein
VANDRRIYSFEIDPSKGTSSRYNTPASDNDPRSAAVCLGVCAVNALTIYEFDEREGILQTLYRAESAFWNGDRIEFEGPVEKTTLLEGKVVSSVQEGGEVVELGNPFAEVRKKPSHLNIAETKAQLESSEADVEKRSFAIALEKEIYDDRAAVCDRALYGSVCSEP